MDSNQSAVNRLVRALTTETLIGVRDDVALRFSVAPAAVHFEFRTMDDGEFAWTVFVRMANVVIGRGDLATSGVRTKKINISGFGRSLQEAIDDIDRDIAIKTASAKVKR